MDSDNIDDSGRLVRQGSSEELKAPVAELVKNEGNSTDLTANEQKELALPAGDPAPKSRIEGQAGPGDAKTTILTSDAQKPEVAPEEAAKTAHLDIEISIPDVKDSETIQLIEETIIIPEDPDKPVCKEDIKYDVIEYTEMTLTKSPSPAAPMVPEPADEGPKHREQNGSESADGQPVELADDASSTKKRSLIEDIYDDWSDGNPEEEETKLAGDAVEDQLKNLLDEKISKSPKTPKLQKIAILAKRSTPQSQKVHEELEVKPPVADSPIKSDLVEEKLEAEEKKPLKCEEPSADSKELLAILEGDADPDWANLKSPGLPIESKSEESDNSPAKVNASTERQVALQQLLDLPITSKKLRTYPRKSPVIPKEIFDDDGAIEEVKLDESRSGRKRKPTEKVRENEISAKRQKFVKPVVKAPVQKAKEAPSNKPKDSPDAAKQKQPSPDKVVRKSAPKVSNTFKTPTKKSPKASAPKFTPEGSPKPRKKVVNEIDRLLQDEGVVNLLYDVEQPAKRRLVPVTKSQAKVMDIEKVQKELKIRTKLVKNAVLRLRTSTAPGAKAPRAKRIGAGSVPVEDPEPAEQANPAPANEFLFPAKIRNAADASVIVRRHSSSSFSSASGSPRVSIDSTDRLSSFDDGRSTYRVLKSNKRSHASDSKKVDAKKCKRLSVSKLSDIEFGAPKSRKGKRASKSKDSETDQEADDDVRSNGTGKLVKSQKKNTKSKVYFAKHDDGDDDDDLIVDEQDELSVCLAEAVSALANDSRGRNSVLSKKVKGSPSKIQFSNKEINVQRHGNLVQLILTPSTPSKIRNGITLQMMHEFRDVLAVLKNDDSCRVVLLTSTGSCFCEGLELSTLLDDDKEARKTRAQLLADGVKEFIKSLATFNKPIVAGVQGSAVGLGVTMLPLFDLVIASDKASFSTPYGKLGQIAEGAAIFTLSHILGNAVTSELLLGGRTLTANEALRAGLVTRVMWPDRFHIELLPSLRAMSEQSSQSMEATKALLRHSLRTKLSAALESESYLLVQHWCSQECQDAIRDYLEEKVQ